MRITLTRSLLCIFMACLSFTASAQDTILQADSLQKPRIQKFYFGIGIGSVKTIVRDFEPNISDYFTSTGIPEDSLLRYKPVGLAGLYVGFVFTYNFTPSVFARFSPGIMIGNCIGYKYSNGVAEFRRTITVRYFNLPLHIGYTFTGKRLRPVVVAGGTLNMDYNNQYKRQNNHFFTADAGLALEIKLGKMIFAPEFRYGHALNSTIVTRFRKQGGEFADRMRLNTMTIVLNLKGGG